jgi:hypothetical protein
MKNGGEGCTSKWCEVVEMVFRCLKHPRAWLGVPIVLVLCGGAWTKLGVNGVLWRLVSQGEWKLVPLICKRGSRSDGQYREQGEGAYHARFFLCFISL